MAKGKKGKKKRRAKRVDVDLKADAQRAEEESGEEESGEEDEEETSESSEEALDEQNDAGDDDADDDTDDEEAEDPEDVEPVPARSAVSSPAAKTSKEPIASDKPKRAHGPHGEELQYVGGGGALVFLAIIFVLLIGAVVMAMVTR